ncbi:MAG TPA: hypothetical protein VLH56_06230 [Dissulfurispiraceae bacterium]|nr:hypothetical protein [Dissulfurispiraceae bacterium]
MISIDARGLRHPDHINAFRDELTGICGVFEDVEILFDNLPEERKKLEMFLRSCRAAYSIEKSPEGHLRIFVQQPFSLCG